MNNPLNDQQANILIVDDMPQNLHLLRRLLTANGFAVRPMPNGRLALASAKASVPDLILLDVLMPEIDGYEVCRQLKADPATVDVPVIFVSALDDPFDKVKAFEVGAVDYVTKPFQVNEVLARVRSHVTIYRLQQQLYEKIGELSSVGRTIAHDIREPLSSLVSLSEMLRTNFDELDIKTRHSILESMTTTSSRLLKILDELLVLAGIHHNAMQYEKLDMARIVKRAYERLGVLQAHQHVTLVLPNSWVAAKGKTTWVEEVWYNYLSNGVKYGGETPILQLGSCLEENGFARFWVSDNGQGISIAEQSKLFQPFSRVGENEATGHGLGLSIVQRIIHKLGGDVGVESDVGKGSTFYFTLPQFS